jgi:hypothetical protein
MGKDLEVELTDLQVEILLEYGYPFEREEKQLKEFAIRKGSHLLKTCDFYLPRLSGDLVYSLKNGVDESIAEEFDELWYKFDIAIGVAPLHMRW